MAIRKTTVLQATWNGPSCRDSCPPPRPARTVGVSAPFIKRPLSICLESCALGDSRPVVAQISWSIFDWSHVKRRTICKTVPSCEHPFAAPTQRKSAILTYTLFLEAVCPTTGLYHPQREGNLNSREMVRALLKKEMDGIRPSGCWGFGREGLFPVTRRSNFSIADRLAPDDRNGHASP